MAAWPGTRIDHRSVGTAHSGKPALTEDKCTGARDGEQRRLASCLGITVLWIRGGQERRADSARPSGGVVDLDELHHAEVFVVQDVAVQDEAACKVLEAGAHRHAAEARHVDGIPPDRLR
jgi:hypothetical protein